MLAKFGHLEAIPTDSATWGVNASRPSVLAATLQREREKALLFRDLATLRADVALFDNVDELRWKGPTPAFAEFGERFDRAARGAQGLGPGLRLGA